MKLIKNENAKQSYTYIRYEMNDIRKMQNYIFKDVVETHKFHKSTEYIKLYCGFDIETTNINTEDNEHYAIMYKWQLSFSYFNRHMFYAVISGRTYDEFIELLIILEHQLQLSKDKRIIIWIANMSFEFQFIRKWLNITDYFLRENRKPFYILHNDTIEFREALNYNGNSLNQLAKNTTNTQKCVGDLDYSIIRNKNTQLTEEEERYCDNDVLILSEFSEWFFSKFMNEKKKNIPLTIQSIIRQEQKKQAKNYNKDITDIIQNARMSERLYNKVMSWLFRGGYTHGNIKYIDTTLTKRYDIDSWDFTSSYPACMLQCYYPFSFNKIHNDLSLMNDKHCYILDIILYNVDSTTCHSIESKSKCIELENAVIDNGRIRKCDKMHIILTERDFETYKKFYKWDKIEVLELWESIKIRLPGYMTNIMYDNYVLKHNLKNEHKDYSFQKSIVNSCYGVAVTKNNEKNIEYKNDEYIIEDSDSYYSQTKNNVLLAQWGCWITSQARNRLLDIIYEIETTTDSEVVYCDTDSIYCINSKYCHNIIDDYNNNIFRLNKLLCDKYKMNYEIFKDLGAFDSQTENGNNPITCFKYLGAKRYIYVQNGHIKQTVAGLPKSVLSDYAKMFHAKRLKLDLFKFFENEMEIEHANKLISDYNDDEFSIKVGDTIHYEKSCITLYETSFTLTLDKLFIETYKNFQKSIENKEKRGLIHYD